MGDLTMGEGTPGKRAATAGTEALEGRQSADISDVLSSITDCYYTLDEGWRITDVNRQALKYLGKTRKDLLGQSLWEAFPYLCGTVLERHFREASATRSPAHFELHSKPYDRWAEVHAYPSGSGLSVYFRNITDRKKREEELRRLNRTLTAHNKSSHAMMRAEDEIAYLDEICRVIVNDCGHAMVWIGYAEDDEQKSIRPVAYSGFEEGYLETLGLTWADTERGRGPTGTAIRTGKPSTCRDMLTDPKFEPWREQALKRGYASSIVLPLKAEGKVFGAITIYSSEPDPFSDDEVALLTELADDLAYGIMAIRLRAERRRAEDAQMFLLQCAGSASGEDFFRSLAYYLATTLDMDFICIDRLTENCQAAETVAVYFDGKFEDNVSYALKDTPCGDVVGKTICCFPRDVRGLFPRDEVLQEMMAEGYVGTTLWSSQGQPIGLIAMISRKPLGNARAAESLLKLVAIRAAAELERKQAEEALKKYQMLSENSRDVILFVDLDGQIVEANAAAVSAYGYTRSELLGLTVFDLRATDKVEQVAEQMAAAESGGILFETWHRRKDGTDLRVEVSSRGTDMDGQRVLLSIIRDVTERKRSEEEIARQKDELYEREHHIANVLQQALVPPHVPNEIYGFSIGVRYQPALKEAEVGGDFYDVFELGDGKIGVLIGDVVGKGLAAAIRVAAARYSVRSYAFIDPRPSHVMTLANVALCQDRGDESGMLTAFFAVINTTNGRVTYTSAGHEPPLVCRASGGIEELWIGGMPLGVRESSEYVEEHIDLGLGDTIVMVTDGITEARAPGPVLFEKKGMIGYLAETPGSTPDEAACGLLRAATAHAGGQLQDDAAIVVVSMDRVAVVR